MSCSLGTIHWCQFDWQSFSTLTTGLAAVIGASIIGLKQAVIAKRQADISEKQSEVLRRQVELEEAKLRADLFQRRLETFEVTTDFIFHIMDLPDVDAGAEERIRLFGTKMRESQFLFSNPNVYTTLVAFWEKGNAARFDRSLAIAARGDGTKHDPDRIRRLQEYPVWSLKTLETLSEIFRPDLSIMVETEATQRRANDDTS